jgi:molybdenum cofactor guanylyltransferase
LTGISPLVISANDRRGYEPFGKPVIADLRAGRGPLGGIEVALAHYSTEIHPQGVLFLPCDLPAMSAAEITRLRDAFLESHAQVVVAETEGQRQHPLCVIVRPSILEEVRRALDEDRREVNRLWRELGAVGVSFSETGPFFNVNTLEDYTAWKGKYT